MPRLIVQKALTYHSHGLTFVRGQPLEVTDEGAYHQLVQLGRTIDPDKPWQFVSPREHLPRLAPGEPVLVARAQGLGDVLMVSIVLRALCAKFPHLAFTYAVASPYVPLFRDCDFLAGVVSLWTHDGPQRNVVELRGLSERSPLRQSLDRIDLFAGYCGVELSDYSFPLRVREKELDHGREILGAHAGEAIVLAVRGSTAVRSWPQASVHAFALEAAERGATVALVDPHELPAPEHPRILNLTGKLRVPDLLCAMAAAEWVVSPDTGVTHLAEAVGTRCVAIYSTVPPSLRVGHYHNVRAIWRGRDLPCCPCFDRGCKPIPCLTSITSAHVFEAMERFEELPPEVPARVLEGSRAAASAA